MPGRRTRTAKFSRRYARHVDADLATLAVADVALVDAALVAVDDLAHGRQRGRALGERIEVLGIGERAEHAVYRDVLTRLGADPKGDSEAVQRS